MGTKSALDRVKVEIVRTPEQFQAAMDVRSAVYVDDIHWLTPETLVDRWDDRCVQFIGTVDGRAVTSGRLNDNPSGFEIEQYMDLGSLRANGGCAELSRLSVLPEWRRSMAAMSMFRAFYRYAQGRGIRHFCITLTPNNLRMYESLGFTYIGGPFQNELLGVNHAVYCLDLEQASVDWRKQRPRIADQFEQPLDGIG